MVDSWLAYLTPWRASDRGSGAKELDPAQRALRKRQKKLLDSGVSKINAGINLISGGAYQATPVDHGDDDGGKSSKRPNAWKGDFGNGFYKKADYERVWEPFVVHNYLVRGVDGCSATYNGGSADLHGGSRLRRRAVLRPAPGPVCEAVQHAGLCVRSQVRAPAHARGGWVVALPGCAQRGQDRQMAGS